jgi:hypothetical protein
VNHLFRLGVVLQSIKISRCLVQNSFIWCGGSSGSLMCFLICSENVVDDSIDIGNNWVFLRAGHSSVQPNLAGSLHCLNEVLSRWVVVLSDDKSEEWEKNGHVSFESCSQIIEESRIQIL